MELRHLNEDGTLEPGFVLVQHRWRTDKDGKPLVDTMSELVYKNTVAFRGEDPTNDSGHTVDIPKQGWDLIDPDSLKTPKAAVEAQENKAQEETKAEEVASEPTEEETASEEAPAQAQEATNQSSTSSRRRRNTKPK